MNKLNNISKILDGVEHILEGIRFDECEDTTGWWETSTGAEFGNKKADELKAYIRQSFTALIKGIELEEKKVREYSTYRISGEIQSTYLPENSGYNQAAQEVKAIINKLTQ